MQNEILHGADITCILVEVIAKNSQDIPWKITIDGTVYEHAKIRRVSIDKFYEIVTGEQTAFKQLCDVLPVVINDVVSSLDVETIENSVFDELNTLSDDILKSLYELAFKKYEGFDIR